MTDVSVPASWALLGLAGLGLGAVGLTAAWRGRRTARLEQRLRASLGELSLGVGIQDAELRYTSVWGELLGYAPDQLRGRTDAEVFPERLSRRLTELKRRVLGSGAVESMDVQIEAEDGSRWWTLRAEPSTNRVSGRGIVVRSLEVTEERRSAARVAEYRHRLRLLASEIALTEERERRRIAVLLHDDIVQALAACRLELEAVLDGQAGEPSGSGLRAVLRRLDDVIATTRRLVFDLTPPVLYQRGFRAAVEWLVERTCGASDLESDVRFEGDAHPMPDDLEILLFQAVREVLTNVAKHAAASRVELLVAQSPADVRIEIADDGRGFDVAVVEAGAGARGGFGLFSIRDRLDLVGGHLELRSVPGEGSYVRILTPLPAPDPATDAHRPG